MTTRHLDPVPPDHKETAAMSRIYTHAQAGEPNAHLNDHNPADPFVVVGFGADWDFTSKDPHWCRRVAATCPRGRAAGASERKTPHTGRTRNRLSHSNAERR